LKVPPTRLAHGDEIIEWVTEIAASAHGHFWHDSEVRTPRGYVCYSGGEPDISQSRPEDRVDPELT